MVAFIRHLWKKNSVNDYFGFAAQLSYYFLLSMFPLLIFLVTLLPYLPLTQADLLAVFRDYAPSGSMELIEKNLSQISKNGTLLSVGIIGTLFSASNGIDAIVKALNRAYEVTENRSFLRTRITAILLTLAMIFVIIVALILPIFGKQIGVFLFSQFKLSDQFIMVWNALRWLVSAVIIFVIFVGLYWLAPSKKIACRSTIPGAVFATLGWIVTSWGFSFYVSNFQNYSATYGSIGAVIVLMTWLYISGIIIIIGGEVNSFYSKEEKSC
jgi:membrane protein